MEDVVANPKVRSRIAKLCVGLAAPADPPGLEKDLLIFLTPYMKDAKSVPYGVFLTHDLKYVHGFSDTRTLAQFVADLDLVEKSPLVPASVETEKQLAAAVKTLEPLVEKEDWPKVMGVVRKTQDLTGRCPQRDELNELIQFVRDYAAARFDWVEETATSGGDVAAAKKELKALAKLMKGEPEAATASQGLDALVAFAKVARLKGDVATKARTAAAKRFADGRWASLFDAR